MDPKTEERIARALERFAAAAELYALVAAEEHSDPLAEETEMSDVEYARRVVIENQCDGGTEADIETP